jgi:hypothetical protein
LPLLPPKKRRLLMPAGRRPNLTPEMIDGVRRLVPVVFYLKTVADYLGVPARTLRHWRQRGRREADRLAAQLDTEPEQSERLFFDFHQAFTRGLAEGELHELEAIRQASPKHWQAAAWRLERRFPEKWGSHRRELALLRKKVRELQKALDQRGFPPDRTAR